MNECALHEMLDGSVELRLAIIWVRHIRYSARCVIPRFPNKEVNIINNLLRLNEMKENINKNI